MTIKDLQKKDLPDQPGVYFFKKKSEIIYIGRATSLRDRVKSYFKDDVFKTRGPLIVDMVTEATNLDWIIADSVLEAIILEANFIKKYQPHANSREKDDKSFNFLVFTREDFPTLALVRAKDLYEHYPKKNIKYAFGPYPNGFLLKESLRILRRIFPYRDKKCIPNQGRPCFSKQVGLCPGVCTGEVTRAEYGRTIQNLKLLFEGKKIKVVRKLESEMKAYSRGREFEKANEVKKTIFALKHIQDLTLIKDEHEGRTAKNHDGVVDVPESVVRIEGYDIAHISGTSTAGVMVVLEGNHIKKSDYRLFKVRHGKGNNDVLGLREVLSRRLNHAEWPFPNIIVVDGGTAQKNAAEELLRERGFDITVVSVKKDTRHRPEELLGDDELTLKYKREILLVNSEAHRFAIKYHRKLRSKSMFG